MSAYILGTGLLLLGVLTSCVGSETKTEGKKFAPTEKQSSLSDSERQAAIAEKRVSLNATLDDILISDGVKFSVLPPVIGNGVSEAASQRLATKIINIAAQNGIGGLALNPVLGLVTKVERTESSITNTAPQKTVVKYELTLYCGNFISNDIYASASTTVAGVGANLEAATLQAFSDVKDTPALKEMFKKASENAVKWYDNESNINMLLDAAMSEQNYPLAMALLSSVPAQCTTREYAVKRNAEITALFFQSNADALFSRMQAAISSSNGEYNPEVGALYSLIPHNYKVWEDADKVFAAYCKALDSDRRDAIARDRAVKDRDAANAQILDLEKLQVEKIKSPYAAQATIARINADCRVGVARANAEGKKNANTGGFLGLGKLWDGGFKLAEKLLDKLDE